MGPRRRMVYRQEERKEGGGWQSHVCSINGAVWADKSLAVNPNGNQRIQINLTFFILCS